MEECSHNCGRITGIFIREITKPKRVYAKLLMEGVEFRILTNPRKKTKYKKEGIEVTVHKCGSVTFTNLPKIPVNLIHTMK